MAPREPTSSAAAEELRAGHRAPARRAGPRRARAAPRPSPSASRPSWRTSCPGRVAVDARRDSTPDGRATRPAVGLEERARPAASAPGPAAPAPARGRAGSRRAVATPERPGQRAPSVALWRRRQPCRRATVRASGPSELRARAAPPRASSAGVVSVPSSGQAAGATIGPVSMPASIRMIVTPAALVALADRRRDRRRAPVARQQRGVDVEDAVARQVEDAPAARSGRSRQGRRGPAGARRPAATASSLRAARAGWRRGSPGRPGLERDRGRAQELARGRPVDPAPSRRRRARSAGCASDGVEDRHGEARRSRRRPSGPGRPPARGAGPAVMRAAGVLTRDVLAFDVGAADSPSASSPASPATPPRRRRTAAHGDQLVHRVEVVDVELAVEVVELVLEGPPEQARSRRP